MVSMEVMDLTVTPPLISGMSDSDTADTTKNTTIFHIKKYIDNHLDRLGYVGLVILSQARLG
jgi:hypothetical protein